MNKDPRTQTTREVVNEEGETEIRPVLAVVDRSKYRPGGSRITGPRPDRDPKDAA